MQGRAFKFGDNISTDHIAPGRLFHLRSNLEEFAIEVLHLIETEFSNHISNNMELNEKLFDEVMQKLCYNLHDQNLKGNKFV